MNNRTTRILALVVLIASCCFLAFFIVGIALGQTDNWASLIGSAFTALAMVILLIRLRSSE